MLFATIFQQLYLRMLVLFSKKRKRKDSFLVYAGLLEVARKFNKFKPGDMGIVFMGVSQNTMNLIPKMIRKIINFWTSKFDSRICSFKIRTRK